MIKTMRKCLALMTRMKINTNILVFLSIFHTKILLNWSYFLEQKPYFLMKIRPKMVLKVLFLMTKFLWEPWYLLAHSRIIFVDLTSNFSIYHKPQIARSNNLKFPTHPTLCLIIVPLSCFWLRLLLSTLCSTQLVTTVVSLDEGWCLCCRYFHSFSWVFGWSLLA